MKRNLVFTIFALSTVFFAFQNCSHKVDFNGLSSSSPSDKALVATDAADGTESSQPSASDNNTDSQPPASSSSGSVVSSGSGGSESGSGSSSSGSVSSGSDSPQMGQSGHGNSNPPAASNASNSSDRPSDSEGSDNGSNSDLVRCDLQNGFKLGIINNALDGVHPNVQAVCISRAKCLNDVSKYFEVKAARDIGACEHNPHMTVLSDADLDALLAKLAKP